MKNKNTWILLDNNNISNMCYNSINKNKNIFFLKTNLIKLCIENNYNLLINNNFEVDEKLLCYLNELDNVQVIYKYFKSTYKDLVNYYHTHNINYDDDSIRLLYRKYYPKDLRKELDQL